ncbi:MAG: hypothetical protein WBC86_14775, partial [Pseudolabrys sp.]
MKKLRKKVGRPATKVTATQRRRIMIGVTVGLKLDQLALDIGMAESTMCKVFASEIKTARTRLILDNLERLHKAAERGNVSAIRALAKMMHPKIEDVEDADDN